MIHVFYYRASDLHPRFEYYLHQLPINMQEPILRFRDRRDAQRSLFGKLLLVKGLFLLGLSEHQLTDLNYTNYNRPYFSQYPDFNIAHSGEFVVCAISKTNKVGIDIEEVKPTVLNDFRYQFTGDEWTQISTSANMLHEFYTLWTQKEAIIKASGEGLSIPLKKIHIANGKAAWDNQELYLYPLEISPSYRSHLATDTESPEIDLQQLRFD